MSSKIYLRNLLWLLTFSQMIFHQSYAEVKTWTGNAGDGQWSSSNNWNNSSIPLATDDVLMDNSFVANNYTVTLPTNQVSIKSFLISPSTGKIILVILPSTNITEPALSVTGPGYGLRIDNGGIFQNSSGLTSGESLMIADSILINNGGRYIHRTRASHANNIVRLLSRASGTENGIFEFDVPRVSYTVSMSNRTYGNLVFSSSAAGGAISYTCSGSNPLTIRGNLQINAGVNFSVDLSGVNGNMLVLGDYIQNGGTFNVASGASNTTIVNISGNLIQSAGGLITETNSGFPTIQLNGSSQQIISLAGSIANQVSFRVNNHEGAILLSRLQLPYKLELVQGKINTSNTNLLTLLSGCTVTVDSTSSNTSFVEGPMRKEGLTNEPFFLFPVGKNASLRWLELKNASGNFTVEFFRNNPRLISNTCGPGIDHISSVEYWELQTDGQSSSAQVELSYVVPASGGITDLSFLNVARLDANIWLNAGHSGVSGSIISGGSVISDQVADFQLDNNFAMASTVNLENPLPVEIIDFNGRIVDTGAELSWRVNIPTEVREFEIQNGLPDQWHTLMALPASLNSGEKEFSTLCGSIHQGPNYFRLRVTDINGIAYLSKILRLDYDPKNSDWVLEPSILQSNRLSLRVNATSNLELPWLVVAMDGRLIAKGFLKLQSGRNHISIELPFMAAGMYQFVLMNQKNKMEARRFIRL